MSLNLERDPNVAEIVVSVGDECLSLCETLIGGTKIDKDDDPLHLAVTLCLVYFLGKIQRVTRAALTLILSGQGREAMSLIREQNHFVVSLNYYWKHPDQAQLFMVSQVLLKKRFAKEIMAFDEKVALDPRRVAQLAAIEKDVEEAYRQFPGLRRPKGKSGQRNSPVFIDWSEPSSYDMFRDLMDRLVREHHEKHGEIVDQAEFSKRFEHMVARTYFYRNTFMSQAKHGTAFDIGTNVDFNDDGNVRPTAAQVDDPNGLAYHFIQNAMPSLLIFRDHNVPGAFEGELDALGDSYVKLREALGITDQPVNI
jgi:hypothetical protein